MKKMFKELKFYRRRLELCAFITLFYIVFGYLLNAFKTKDFTDIQYFMVSLSRIAEDILISIVPFFVIFIVVSTVMDLLFNEKGIRFFKAICLGLGMMFVAYGIVAADEVNLLVNDVVEIFQVAQKFLFEIRYIVFFFYFLSFVSVVRNKKARKVAFRFIKNGLEIVILSVGLYYLFVLRNFNIIEFFNAYWLVVVNGVRFTEKISNGVILAMVIIVFVLIYYSIIRAVLRHECKDKKNTKSREMLNDEDAPLVAVIVPAYNEEKTIVKTVDSILDSNYPLDKLQVAIVSDGSADDTVSVAKRKYQMVKLSQEECRSCFPLVKHKPVNEIWRSTTFPNVILFVKLNGGKFDAINTGMQFYDSSVLYCAVIDADTTLDKNAFRILATEAEKATDVIAFAGTIAPRFEHIKTFKDKLLTIWQYHDYNSSFRIARAAASDANAMMIISGAFGFFRRQNILGLKGYKESLGEDIFLTLEIQSKKGKIAYIPDAVAYTQVPTTFRMLKSQRMRWFKGLTESLVFFKTLWIKEKRMIVTFAEFGIIEWLTPIMAPFGFVNLLARPEIMQETIFQVVMCLTLITPVIQAFVSMYIESYYQKVDWSRIFYLPFQLIMSPLIVLWRNDGLMDFNSKAWGNMTRK